MGLPAHKHLEVVVNEEEPCACPAIDIVQSLTTLLGSSEQYVVEDVERKLEQLDEYRSESLASEGQILDLQERVTDLEESLTALEQAIADLSWSMNTLNPNLAIRKDYDRLVELAGDYRV